MSDKKGPSIIYPVTRGLRMRPKPRVLVGSAETVLVGIAPETYQTCITSPPYFNQRDYGCAGQIGLEGNRDDYIARLVEVFREVRRTLRNDGTLWLNIADTYVGKRLMGIPWRLAFALEADGWIIRQDIIWSKPNPMPEPVKDRCVRAHEYIFLLSKKRRYKFVAERIRERGRSTAPGAPSPRGTRETHGMGNGNTGINAAKLKMAAEFAQKGYATANKKSVWECQKVASRYAHFATFPEDLIEPMLIAASDPGDRVLDPFGGSGTTGVVAKRLRRRCDLIELSPEYAKICRKRVAG